MIFTKEYRIEVYEKAITLLSGSGRDYWFNGCIGICKAINLATNSEYQENDFVEFVQFKELFKNEGSMVGSLSGYWYPLSSHYLTCRIMCLQLMIEMAKDAKK